MWTDVKKEVPKVELHVFYGWQLFDQFYSSNPASMAWKEKIVNLMKQDGVTHHGRVPQHELVKEYEESGIWAYPTHFGEINCISAIKAQAYGCEPVVINYAALKETVQYGRKVEGDIYDKETQEVYKKELIDALKHSMDEKVRKEMMEWASKKYAWSEIAKSWDAEFRKEVV
jgi:glycosyltransferase involved in cell wall biosynthesis